MHGRRRSSPPSARGGDAHRFRLPHSIGAARATAVALAAADISAARRLIDASSSTPPPNASPPADFDSFTTKSPSPDDSPQPNGDIAMSFRIARPTSPPDSNGTANRLQRSPPQPRQHLSPNGIAQPMTREPATAADLIALNVGGQTFRCRAATIRRLLPESRLGQFVGHSHEARLRLCDSYFEATEEYFFERSARLFDCVFKFYLTGQLHRPFDVCEMEFIAELQYWRIAETHVAPCCVPRYDPIDDMEEEAAAKKHRIDETLRQRLHRFCIGDGTPMSTAFTFISICFVLISVFGLVLGSIEEFQIPFERVGNVTQVVTYAISKAKTPPGVTWEPHPAFSYVEMTCIAWFTLEYVLRWTVAPERLQFMRGVLNVVDLLAILPFYLELCLGIFGLDFDSLSDIKGAFLVVRIMRVLRVVRILKLSRYSTGMRTFALTLRSSARQLGMMGMVLFTGVIFFSTLLYYVEKDEPESPFTSIPAAFWWAIVTMSTVGYGDQIPKTILGKTIASGAILSGVLVLALPITVIVDNFMKVSGSVQPRPAIQRPRRPHNSTTSVPSPPFGNGAATISISDAEKTQLTE